MVKAEISYNPYLRETKIRFNGQEPRINSLVEKYQNEYLQTWVKKIPKIFYDEMNGYDFELEFTGTKLDFQDVVDAFREAGVTEEQVHLFHKNELNDRIQKDTELDYLIKWMIDHKNPRFDVEELIKENSNLFDLTYPLVMIHGDDSEEIDFGRIKVSGEVVNQVSELDKTDLMNTPIVFFLDRTTKGLLQGELWELLDRSDVTEQQLFFMIHTGLDFNKMERIIRDLGIKKPQIIQSVNDEKIQKYLKLYPVSEYLYQAVSLLRERMDAVYAELQESNKKAIEANREIHTKINQYETLLENLKAANYQFKNRDNLDMPERWASYKTRMLMDISSWRSRKTKITGEVEGMVAASEFNSDASTIYWTCINNMQEEGILAKASIINMFVNWYHMTGVEEKFDSRNVEEKLADAPDFPNLEGGLNQLKVTEYVNDRPNLMGFFKNTNTEQSVHPVTVYYMEKWRDYAGTTLLQTVNEYAETYLESLKNYLYEVAAAYIQKIEQLIEIYSEKKAETVALLSEEEHLLQIDNDWVTVIRDQLNEIERG